MRGKFPVLVFCIPLLLAGCEDQTASDEIADTPRLESPEESRPAQPLGSAPEQIGTPMEERVATIGVLNKRNNVSQDLQLSPGDSEQVGDVEVTLQACERTPPWEMPKETGAFVQVSVRDRGEDDFSQIFSGWLFKNSPSLNVVEHPIYDVWVKDCAMSFPGEE
ncbi:MAG TPA: DUF2155 domain-containing protein [Erythrobacter sp.]|nr:DUF2155 domain-containing protein [Erythrobacter sp.]